MIYPVYPINIAVVVYDSLPHLHLSGWWNSPALHQTFLDNRASEVPWRCRPEISHRIWWFFLFFWGGAILPMILPMILSMILPFGGTIFGEYLYYFGIPMEADWHLHADSASFGWCLPLWARLYQLSTAGSGCVSAYHAFVGPGDSTAATGWLKENRWSIKWNTCFLGTITTSPRHFYRSLHPGTVAMTGFQPEKRVNMLSTFDFQHVISLHYFWFQPWTEFSCTSRIWMITVTFPYIIWLVVCLFFFPYIGKNHPNWLLSFRGVETTNQ